MNSFLLLGSDPQKKKKKELYLSRTSTLIRKWLSWPVKGINLFFKQKRSRNSPGDILLSHFSQHTRLHSPLPPRSDVTEPDVAHSISWKSWRAVVNLVFGLFQDLQRGSNLEKAEYCNTTLFQSSTVNYSRLFVENSIFLTIIISTLVQLIKLLFIHN